MPYFPLNLPPGLYAAGTKYSSKGRYRAADLVRWADGSQKPIGGWRARSDEVAEGVSRAVLTWADNSNQSWIGIGTHTHLYAMSRSGALSDITPSGFTPGRPDSIIGGGYGSGIYGSGVYGVPLPDTTNVLPASVWTLDTFGEYLVGVMDSDNTLYEWQLDPMVTAATIANSPTASALVVTSENILLALGANGNPRYIMGSDIADNTDWTPSATNQARDWSLQTQGEIMLGKRVPNGVLVLTDEGAFLGTYVNTPFVYIFDRVGSGCGAISRQCAAVTQNATFWMGRNGFFAYNGYVSELPCAVQDDVFSDFNTQQSAKVAAILIADFNEVWWLYPSSSSTEVDSAVVFNYSENTWMRHKMDRTTGTGSNGAFQYPVMIGLDGLVYDHEVGFQHDGRAPTSRSGPVEIGDGDNVIMLSRFIPDMRAEGDVTVKFHASMYPNAPTVEYGPYTATSPADVRITARQIEVEYVFTPGVSGRVGDFRFEGKAGGRR